MSTRYLPLIELRIRHGYYATGQCPDFSLTPTPETAKQLRGHRCLLKLLADGLRLLMAVNSDGQPFLPFRAPVTLTFAMVLQNRGLFPLFTDPGQRARRPSRRQPDLQQDTLELPPRRIYSNRDISWQHRGSEALAVIIVEQFEVKEGEPVETFFIHGRQLPGLSKSDFSVSGLGDIKTPTTYHRKEDYFSIDTSGFLQDKPVKFHMRYPGIREESGDFDADIELAFEPEQAKLTNVPRRFHLQFEPQKARWVYYLFVSSADDSFEIKDVDPDGTLLFRKDNPSPGDELAIVLQALNPDEKLYRFVSTRPIQCKETARKTIQLLQGATPLVRSLPNPPIENHRRVVLRRSTREDILYQVIKHVTLSPSRTVANSSLTGGQS